MQQKTRNFLSMLFVMLVIISFTSCSKSDGGSPNPTPPATDACAGKTIVVTATAVAATPCGGNGTVTADATGSTGFTFKLNAGGTYQASPNFTNVAAGGYTVFAKDVDGCEKTAAVTVASSGTAGPTFSAVKTLIAARCQSCHNSTLANGGADFSNECNIITLKARIKVRAVDEGSMPQTGPLPQSEKDIITAWINAGGTYAD